MAMTTKKMAADAAKCPRGLEPPMDGCAVLLYLWLRLRLKDAEQTPSNADPNLPSPLPHPATDFRFPGTGSGGQGDRVRRAAPGASGPTGQDTVCFTCGYTASPALCRARGRHSVCAEQTRRQTSRGKTTAPRTPPSGRRSPGALTGPDTLARSSRDTPPILQQQYLLLPPGW